MVAKKQKKQGFFSRMGQFFNQVVFGNRTTVSLSELASFSDWFNSQPEMYETIFGVVSRLSNTLASLPLHLYDKEYNEPTDCAAYNLMQLGPRYFNQFDLKRDWEALRNLDGNSYTHLIRDRNGNVIDMKLIKPKCCALYIDTNSGTLYYAVSAEDDNSAIQTLYVPYTDILHFKHMRYGTATGIGPVSLLSDTLNYDAQVRKISLSQLNGTN
jgi:HK97 family phage portal protein